MSNHSGSRRLHAAAWTVLILAQLIAWRGDRLRAPGVMDSPVSREGAFLANNVVFTVFAFIVLRGMSRALSEQNLFILLAVAGLLVQFGMQALINMGSSLQLIPTKGMTLPFISYGGSSLLGVAIGLGMTLALTRRRIGRGASS